MKEQKIEELDGELKLVVGELEKLKSTLAAQVKSKRIQPAILENPTKKNFRGRSLAFNSKDDALGIIMHEVRRLRDGYSNAHLKNEALALKVR